jgi:hypothetical protein
MTEHTDTATDASLTDHLPDLEPEEWAALSKVAAQKAGPKALSAYRREILSVLVGGGAAGAMLASATGEAEAADTSVGASGAPSETIDVYADEIRDSGGDVVIDIDDTGALDFQSRALENVDGVNGGGVITDGDGTERDIYVIANGASDPASADNDDIIFEEES